MLPDPQLNMALDSELQPPRPKFAAMNREGLLIADRIAEIMMICDRDNPIYEQISSFSVALYVLGFFDCPDVMSFEDVTAEDAAGFLKAHFSEIAAEDLPDDYHIIESKQQYLLVIGDPAYPVHWALLAETRSPRPFFSKLPFFGCGYDSFEDLMGDFVGIDGLRRSDIHYFQKTGNGRIPPSSIGKIYIVKND